MKKIVLSFIKGKLSSPIYYDCCDTVYGEVIFFCTEEGVYGLHFMVDSLDYHIGLAKKKFPDAYFVYRPLVAEQWWRYILEKDSPVPVVLQGTVFQKKVWQVLCDLPTGQTISYEALAVALGMGAQGARAVGRAVAQNFIALLVPCHRVIKKDGGLSGYRWGSKRKELLIASERRFLEASSEA